MAFARRSGVTIANCLPPLKLGRRGSVRHYLLTAAMMGFALSLRMVIAPVSAGLQYVTFFPAVTVSALLGGYRAGLLATVIGLGFATYFFTPPYYSISLGVL